LSTVASASSNTGVACTAATRTVGNSVNGSSFAHGDPTHAPNQADPKLETT